MSKRARKTLNAAPQAPGSSASTGAEAEAQSPRIEFAPSEPLSQQTPSFTPAVAAPVAWLHNEHATAYVITDRVKSMWLAVKPEHVENYTIPLYGEPA